MKFTAEQIAGILEGEVVGNPAAEVYRLSKIEEGTEGSLTFLSNQKYLNFIYSTWSSHCLGRTRYKVYFLLILKIR